MTHPFPNPPRGMLIEGGALVFAALAALAFGLVLYAYLIAVEAHLVSDRFATAPATLPALALDDTAIADIRARSRRFDAERRAGKPATLTLDNTTINEWFAVTTEIETYRDRIRVQMQDDAMTVMLSVPLNDHGFRGRYLNGAVVMRPHYRDGTLRVALDSVRVGDDELPPRLMDAARVAAFGMRLLLNHLPIRQLERTSRLWIDDSRLHAQVNQ